jgi:tRNA A37 threonylcarbamoyladenosine dehydratase
MHVRFQVDWSRPEWIEDELIRCGARDATLIDEDLVSVTVSANSRAVGEELVRDLLDRVGAKATDTLEPTLAAS